MRIALVEPFYGGSHKNWVDGLIHNLDMDFDLFTLPDRHWKWRMHGAAITLANQFLNTNQPYDLIVATDMLDLSTFLSLTRKKSAGIPVILYFHENQLTYPWSPDDPDVIRKRDNHYAFINYTSALSAERVLFNSEYHRQSFLNALPAFLNAFPDHRNAKTIEEIAAKSSTLHLGLNLQKFDALRHDEKESAPLLLWNHRWEYDKAPETFFRILYDLQDSGFDFKLAVLGESYGQKPAIFEEARIRMSRHIVQWGHVESFDQYAYWLWKADVLPVTSVQDFFGISVVEAAYCQTLPLVPDRLAYPEYLPANCIYESHQNLLDKIKSYSQLQIPTVSVFDWSSMREVYKVIFKESVSRE